MLDSLLDAYNKQHPEDIIDTSETSIFLEGSTIIRKPKDSNIEDASLAEDHDLISDLLLEDEPRRLFYQS